MAQTITNTTQNFLSVEDILDNLIVLKDGSCSMVLETNAINFGLLSEEEQDATIYAYAALLNSLTFSIQILIRSDLKDISGYIKLLEDQEIKQSNPMKKHQISLYKSFITSLITERNVLEKKFYLVIPFSSLELGITQSAISAFGPKRNSLPFDKKYIVDKAKVSLEPKRDHLYRQLGRIGLGARQLKTQELIQLLFSMYNSSSTQGQKITNTSDYTVPLVQPAYIKSKETIMSDTNPTPTNPNPITPPTPTPPPVTPPTPTVPTQPATTPPVPTNPNPITPPTPTPPPVTPPTPITPPTSQPTQPTSPLTPPTPTQDPNTATNDLQATINQAANDLTTNPA